jgi:transposase
MICSSCKIWGEYVGLRAEHEALRTEFAQLREEKVQLEVENGKLKRQLALYQNINAPLPRKRRRALQRHSSEKRFPGRPKGYPGSTRSTPKPDIVKMPEWDDCENCGAPLPPPEDVDHYIVEEISNPSPSTAIDFLKLGGKCVRCGAYNVARHPDCPPSGMFGKNVYVQATLHKFEERLPLEKIGPVFERAGLEISAPTVLKLLWRTSNWLRPEYEGILANIRTSKVVYMDQTGIKVDGANFWIWDFVTGNLVTDPGTFFAIENSKSQKVLEDILGKDWDGTMVCDGLRSHHSFARKSGAKIQRCWAHLLKESKELAEKYAEAKALNAGLHGIFDGLKEALEKEPPPRERRRLARNAKRAMRYWMNKQYKKTRVRKFIEKIWRGFPYWFTFVTTPGVEPTNNRAERALRELVIQRKIIGTLRNEKGVRIYETLPTLLATWKRRGLDLQETLSVALTKAWQTAQN